MNDASFFVYVIKRPEISNDPRKYYGVSHYGKRASPKHRLAAHRKSNSYIGRFVRSHQDVFIRVIYDNLTKEQAFALEAQMVPESSVERRLLNLINEQGGGLHPPSFDELSEEQQTKLKQTRSKIGKERAHLIKRGIESPFAKPYRLISPEGKIFEGVCVNLLCKEKGLSHPSIYRVLNGKINHYRGWRKG